MKFTNVLADVHFRQCGLQVVAWANGMHHDPYCLIHVCLLILRVTSNLQSTVLSMQTDVQKQGTERCCIASGECSVFHNGVSPQRYFSLVLTIRVLQNTNFLLKLPFLLGLFDRL